MSSLLLKPLCYNTCMKCICVVTGVDIWGSNRYMISDGQNNGLNDSNVMYM